jgi:Na+/proline symporter
VSALDWVVLLGTTALIIGVGVWKSRGGRSAASYLRGDYEQRWTTIGLSVMATQASAITFLSTPGQGYEDGMRFVQFYFGLPIAMVVISAVFVPIYYRLRVTTAYEYLETRFDLKTRLLGAFLFLVQRGLGTGVTIYAPAIILSTVLGWPLQPTIWVTGGVVILYTITGGARTVSQTQKQQMVLMLGGMFVAACVVVWHLPSHVTLPRALDVAGALGHMNVVNWRFDWNDRYTIWSGVLGGVFLQLAYFGTDQSQVQRYLGGESITASRLGLLFNGMLKIPMQFGILGVGVLVFVFYQFTAPPLLFNERQHADVQRSAYAGELQALEARWAEVQAEKRAVADRLVAGDEAARPALQAAAARAAAVRKQAQDLVKRALPGEDPRDSDYIFISFVKRWLPSGLFGLLVAVIMAAAMSAVASGLSALGATTVNDFYRRLLRREPSDRHLLAASKAFTVLWGLAALGFASFASMVDNLIQAVNILGSLFYGTVLGLFLVAFFLEFVRGHAAFVAALVSQAAVVAIYLATDVGFLWFNVIGCGLVVVLGAALQVALPRPARE